MNSSSKKMKRAASASSVRFDHPHGVEDEVKPKASYQILLNKYLDLQKEYVSRKRKLKSLNQKREMINGEVRFLRRRRKYLLKSHAPTPTMDQSPHHLNIQDHALQQSRDNAEAETVSTEEVKSKKKLKNNRILSKGPGKLKSLWTDQEVPLKV